VASWLHGPCTDPSCGQRPIANVLARYSPAGYLLPPYHGNYWIGLNTSSYDWPGFTWLDRLPGLDMDTYSHWGSLALGDGSSKVPEPNNQYPPEYCVAANYSMADTDKIWSWADTNCTAGVFPYICKITREWRWLAAAW
jgi:hypothetical protein